MLSHDRWLWFFFFGRLRVPTRHCDLVVPVDWGWGRSNKSLFTGDRVPSIFEVGSATGISTPTLMGTVILRLTDDEGITHSFEFTKM